MRLVGCYGRYRYLGISLSRITENNLGKHAGHSLLNLFNQKVLSYIARIGTVVSHYTVPICNVFHFSGVLSVMPTLLMENGVCTGHSPTISGWCRYWYRYLGTYRTYGTSCNGVLQFPTDPELLGQTDTFLSNILTFVWKSSSLLRTSVGLLGKESSEAILGKQILGR